MKNTKLWVTRTLWWIILLGPQTSLTHTSSSFLCLQSYKHTEENIQIKANPIISRFNPSQGPVYTFNLAQRSEREKALHLENPWQPLNLPTIFVIGGSFHWAWSHGNGNMPLGKLWKIWTWQYTSAYSFWETGPAKDSGTQEQPFPMCVNQYWDGIRGIHF